MVADLALDLATLKLTLKAVAAARTAWAAYRCYRRVSGGVAWAYGTAAWLVSSPTPIDAGYVLVADSEELRDGWALLEAPAVPLERSFLHVRHGKAGA